MEVVHVPIGDLVPYANNAKQHPPKQVDQIANSIRRFGWQQPIVADRDNVVVIGHGRLAAAKQLMLETVPVVYADNLEPEEIDALRLADNKTNESDWDFSKLEEELAALSIAGLDMDQFGFEIGEDWFDSRERFDRSRQEGNEEYNSFLDKFEEPKTTDDCYTPDNIYDAVADWVAAEYGVNREQFVRPFYPGGDYQKEKYPEGAVVVDNPPFSILSEIIRWYEQNGIRFFLFAPALTVFTAVGADVEYIPVGVDITYENGAVVSTSFIDNLGNNRIYVSHELYEQVEAANKENLERMHKNLPKYDYPFEVILAGKIQRLANYGQTLKVGKDECVYRNRMDAQAEAGKDAFGGLFLISERAAAERAAAERAAAERAAATVWKLSEREREIIKGLGNKGVD